MTEVCPEESPISDEPAESVEPENTAVPLIPLTDQVIFPNTTVAFLLDDAARLNTLQKALPHTREVLLVPVDSDESGEVIPAAIGDIATRARVLRLKPQTDGVVVLVEGVRREKLVDVRDLADNPVGVAEAITENGPPPADEHWQAAFLNLREAAVSLAHSMPSISEGIAELLSNIDDPAVLTDMLAANLELSFAEKRRLLNTSDLAARVERLQKHLSGQLRIASLQEKLREDVQNEFSDAQRRAYLREQLRAIQKELGEDNGNDEKVAELKEKLDQAGLPETVNTVIERELSRLERTPTASPDYGSSLDYLETVAGLPWSNLSNETIDIGEAETILDADHYGLIKVKQRLVEYLAVRKLNPDGRGPILCLVGPPGVGKTSLGKSIARALGRSFARIALGGVRDESEIRGHRRTYVGSMMGRIMQEIQRAGTRNPVIMLDEIDKMGADFRGDPASALLEVLDPAQNNSFVDHYLNLPFDLSQVVFITTANVLDTVPAPLRDRMEIVRLSGYTPSEKRAIAQRYLIPRQLVENGLTAKDVQWTDAAVDQIIQNYTREAGVRLLEQKVGAVIRGVAARFARGDTTKTEIDAALVAQTLGPSEQVEELSPLINRIGVVNGLAYTPVGGELLHVEALRFPGSGKLLLTGQLGSVMQESAQAAESLLKSYAKSLGIKEPFSGYDTHVHVPSGAIPKDGPSAGAAIFLAMASLYTQRHVRGDVAMTGEINLRGEVQPIGGLPEKTLAALAAGITTVLIPKGNIKDIPTLPEEVRTTLTLIPVSTVDEVLEAALCAD